MRGNTKKPLKASGAGIHLISQTGSVGFSTLPIGQVGRRHRAVPSATLDKSNIRLLRHSTSSPHDSIPHDSYSLNFGLQYVARLQELLRSATKAGSNRRPSRDEIPGQKGHTQ